MYISKVAGIVLVVLLALPLFSFIATASAVSESETTSALNDADETLASAYLVTLEAEDAGADISSLLIQLDEAGVFLASAHMSYRSEDFNQAIDFANSARNIGEEVQKAADGMKNLALIENVNHWDLIILITFIWVVLTILGSFLGWHVFKKRYFKRVLKMKPEVA